MIFCGLSGKFGKVLKICGRIKKFENKGYGSPQKIYFLCSRRKDIHAANPCKPKHEIFHTEQGLHSRRWYKIVKSWLVCLYLEKEITSETD